MGFPRYGFPDVTLMLLQNTLGDAVTTLMKNRDEWRPIEEVVKFMSAGGDDDFFIDRTREMIDPHFDEACQKTAEFHSRLILHDLLGLVAKR